jgi:hypothetical protein
MSYKDIRSFSVNQTFCHSCPFKPDERGIYQNPELANKVIERTLFKGQQICHGTKNTTLCRGARNYYLEFYSRLGWLENPTDEAWNKACLNFSEN